MKIKFITIAIILGMISNQIFAVTINNRSFEETSVSNDVAWISPTTANTAIDLYEWSWFTQANTIQCGTANQKQWNLGAFSCLR